MGQCSRNTTINKTIPQGGVLGYCAYLSSSDSCNIFPNNIGLMACAYQLITWQILLCKT